MRGVWGFVIALICMLALDFVWLTLTGETLYRPAMGGLERAQADLVPAAAFYLIYVLGLNVLVIGPATEHGAPINFPGLTWKAAVFGLAAFATYDLTGMSVIRGWPETLSYIDMAWGTFNAVVTANVTVLGLRLLRQVKGV